MPDEIVNAPETPAEPAPPPVEPGIAPPESARSQEDWEKRMADKDRSSWEHEKSSKANSERADGLQAEMDAFKSDPFAAYLAMGGTEEHIKERFAGGGNAGVNETTTAQNERIGKLEAALAKRTKDDEDSEYKKSIGAFAGQVRDSFDKDDADAALYMELQEALGADDAFHQNVEAQIGRYKEATGKQLTPAEAAVMIGRDFKGYAEAQRSNQKARVAMAKLYNLTLPDEEPPPDGVKPDAKPGNTLTSDLGKSVAPAADGSDLKLGSDEHLAFLKHKMLTKGK